MIMQYFWKKGKKYILEGTYKNWQEALNKAKQLKQETRTEYWIEKPKKKYEKHALYIWRKENAIQETL